MARSQNSSNLQGWLDWLERTGNRLPHPTLLFVYLCLFILGLSALTSALSVTATHPITGATIHAVNLLSREGLHRILSDTVTNFTHFAPVGTVLVAIMGIGVAEHSGLLATVLRATVLKAPRQLLSFIVVFAGVLSSLAADTGYVVLLPLAAMIFSAAGRSPIAGIAAAFAGVSGGYSANLIISPLDAILAGISTEAAGLIDSGYAVSVAGNYYFLLASTLLISLLGTLVTERWVSPRLSCDKVKSADEQLTDHERRGLKAVAILTLAVIALLLWGLLPASGVLRDAETSSILNSPFIHGIVVIIASYAALAGAIYGKVSGSIQRVADIITGMEKSMATMASYIVLMFFAAQFVSYFSWSQLGTIAAITAAQWLQTLQISGGTLLLGFIGLSAIINLLIGSASAKWALIAPIFVPMFLLLGVSPEATQMAYRIGDSSTNIITPLMPYFGVVVAFVQRYDSKAGIGTVIAMMVPYSVVLLIGWTLLLMLWIAMGWPLGPGVAVYL